MHNFKKQILVFYDQNRKTRNRNKNRAKKHKPKSEGAVFFFLGVVSLEQEEEKKVSKHIRCASPDGLCGYM